VLFVAACGVSPPAEAPKPATDTPLLLDTGAAPRFTLRYTMPDGTSRNWWRELGIRAWWSGELARTASAGAGGTLALRGGQLQLVAKPDQDDEDRATVPFDPRGLAAQYQRELWMDPDAQLALLVPRLPASPVGVGARWKYDERVQRDLVESAHHHEVTLVEVTATTARWHDVETLDAPRQHYNAGDVDDFIAVTGKGEGDVVLDLAAFTLDITSRFTWSKDGTSDGKPTAETTEETEHYTLR